MDVKHMIKFAELVKALGRELGLSIEHSCNEETNNIRGSVSFYLGHSRYAVSTDAIARSATRSAVDIIDSIMLAEAGKYLRRALSATIGDKSIEGALNELDRSIRG